MRRSRRCLGSEFQNIGPATEKARRPYVVSRWDGITSAGGPKIIRERVLSVGEIHLTLDAIVEALRRDNNDCSC